jgi:ATP-dependent RNA helicase DDX51/DBP6
VERGFKGKCYPRLAKVVLSATLTQDPSKLSQLELHHPLLLNSGKKRYRIPTKLESYKLVRLLCLRSSFTLVVKLLLETLWRILTQICSMLLLLQICKSNLKPLSLIVLLQELQGNKCLVFTSSVESSHRLSTLLCFFENLPFKFSEYSRLQRESTRR